MNYMKPTIVLARGYMISHGILVNYIENLRLRVWLVTGFFI